MSGRKIVFVTGGNGGIGYETVKALLQSHKSYHVLLGSRSLEKASVAVKSLREECPESINTVEAVQVDLNSDKSIEKAFEQVKTNPGYIDTLINNAGMAYAYSSISLPLSPLLLSHGICLHFPNGLTTQID